MGDFSKPLLSRIGISLFPFSEPVQQLVNFNFDVKIFRTNPLEFVFPEPIFFEEELLNEEKIVSMEIDEIKISEPQKHFNAFLLNPELIIDLLELLEDDVPELSNDLFVPLTKTKNGGKNYKPEKKVIQPSLFPNLGFLTDKELRVDGYRKSFLERNTGGNQIIRKALNFWDLLLPVLQPPLDYQFIDVLDLPPGKSPKPYQWEGIKFLTERNSALLGDDMGTGKTIQSIVACRLLFQRGIIKKALVVSPLSILSQWDDEFEVWAPSLITTVVRGDVEHRKLCWSMPAHIFITTYETIRSDLDQIITSGNNFDLVILDEVQRIKNRSIGISQSIRKLKSNYRWGLSGTPVENRIEELASIFAFLKPGLFVTDKVTPEQAKRLIQPFFLRRRIEDVIIDLPQKEELIRKLRMGDEQQRTYNKMEKDRIIELSRLGESITAQNIVTLIGELKKICNRDPDTGHSVKMDWIKENLPSICERGNKVLIFTQYVQEDFGGTNWLKQELSEFGPINYSEANTDNKRNQYLSAFESDHNKRVFIGHPKTAGLGLNQLVVANYVIHFDHWWNPAITNQATARAFRPRQTKNVFVYHLWIEDTIEELILQKTIIKQNLYDEVIDSLSTEVQEGDLFEIYDDLLLKHGFQPMNLARSRLLKPNTHPRKMSLQSDKPRIFEELVGNLFQKLGFTVNVTPYSKDAGVDVIALRETGYSNEKLAIQCKYQSSNVGRPVLQQLLGVISSDPSYSYGILVTNADVSFEARDLLLKNGRIRVINGDALTKMFIKYEINVSKLE